MAVKTLANLTLETQKEGYIEIKKYWLFDNGSVGEDTITERLRTARDFEPDEVYNCVTGVSSKLLKLSECPIQVQSQFSKILARRTKRPPQKKRKEVLIF